MEKRGNGLHVTGGFRNKLICMLRNMKSVGVFMSLVGKAWLLASSEGDSIPQVQHKAMSFLHIFVSVLVQPESDGVLGTSGIS